MAINAESVLEITQLLARYGRVADVGPWHGMRDLFTEWATFDLGSTTLSGQAEILAFYERAAENRIPTRHVISNVLVEMKGDREANVVSTLTLYNEQRGTTPALIGDYVDRLVREGKTWRFAERAFVLAFRSTSTPPSVPTD